MAFINNPPPVPGTLGHDDDGVPHLNVPGQGLVQVPPALMPMELQNSPMGQSGGASAPMPVPAPIPSNAPAMAPAKNDMGFAIVNNPVAPNPPAAPYVNPAAQSAPAAPMMPQIQSVKESKTESKHIRSEDKAAMDKTNAALADAIHADANAQAAKSNAEATLLDAHALELQQQNQHIQEQEAQRQKAIAERMADVDKAIAQQASMSVDPNYFGRMDTPAKIATSVGILLSGIGAGWGGGENLALDQVNKAIDRDIDAQKANIAKQGQVVAAKRGGYQDFLAATQDQRSAELAEHNRQTEIFKNRLEQVVAKSNDPIVQAAAQKNIAAIEAQQAANVAQMQAVSTEQGTKKAVSLGQGGGSSGVNQRIPQNLAQKQIDQREALAQLEALDKQLNDKKVTDYMGAAEGAVRSKALGKNVQATTSDEAAYYNAAARAAKAQTFKALYGASVSKQDQEAGDSFTPNGLSTSPKLERIRIKQARDKVLREQKITDDIVNAYRTGKVVDSEPKP